MRRAGRRQPRQLRPHPRGLSSRAGSGRPSSSRPTRSQDPVCWRSARYRGVLVSPGPGAPADAGASIAVVRSAAGLPASRSSGVCLGHQAIGEAFGATVVHAPELMHGMTSLVEHDGGAALRGAPEPVHRRRATTPWRSSPGESAGRARRHRAAPTSGVIMGIATARARAGRAVPPRERHDRGRSSAARELARGHRIPGCRGPWCATSAEALTARSHCPEQNFKVIVEWIATSPGASDCDATVGFGNPGQVVSSCVATVSPRPSSSRVAASTV